MVSFIRPIIWEEIHFDNLKATPQGNKSQAPLTHRADITLHMNPICHLGHTLEGSSFSLLPTTQGTNRNNVTNLSATSHRPPRLQDKDTLFSLSMLMALDIPHTFICKATINILFKEKWNLKNMPFPSRHCTARKCSMTSHGLQLWRRWWWWWWRLLLLQFRLLR